MNKPALATLGVVGACAACCAIPLAIPLLSGLSLAGLVSIDWAGLTLSSEGAVGAGLAATILVGGGMWWYRRRKAAARCAAPASAPAPNKAGCGCSSTPARESA